MRSFSTITATLSAFLVSIGILSAQSKPAPDTSAQTPSQSRVVIRQSGSGNSATVTQSGGGKPTTVVTSTSNGNTTTVRHDGPSSVHIEQSPAPERTQPKPEKRKKDE